MKKRAEAKGGSARKEFITTKQYAIPPCFLSWWLSFCPLGRGGGSTNNKFEAVCGANQTLTNPAATTTPSSSIFTSIGSVESEKHDGLLSSPSSTHSRHISYGTKRDHYYALKTLLLQRCSSYELKRELMNEVEILKQLDHPNIVKAIETYDYNGRLYLVLELCSGGDLYTRDPYTEEQAAKIVADLLSAVSYLHEHNIVHRYVRYVLS